MPAHFFQIFQIKLSVSNIQNKVTPYFMYLLLMFTLTIFFHTFHIKRSVYTGTFEAIYNTFEFIFNTFEAIFNTFEVIFNTFEAILNIFEDILTLLKLF